MEPQSKKTLGTVIGLAVGVIVYILVKQFVFAPPSFDKVMLQAASELNKNCPIMIDQDTRLDNAIALPGNIFQYNYTLVNLDKASLDIAEFENYMHPMILNNVKTNPDMKIYRDNGTTMAYYYKDRRGEFIMRIMVGVEEYAGRPGVEH